MVVQARSDSARLPRKVLKPLSGDRSVIGYMLERISLSRKTNKVIVATTSLPSDDLLAQHCQKLGFECYRGSDKDVLERFYEASKEFEAEIIVRLTADCPLVDPAMLDEMIERFKDSNVEYMCNQYPPTYPDGFDIDIFSFELLQKTHREANSKYDREHVTPYMKKIVVKNMVGYPSKKDYSHYRVTLDESADYELLKIITKNFDKSVSFTWQEVVDFLENNPDLVKINSHLVMESPSFQLSRGEKLYQRAKQIIPGGNSLLSKRPEMFLPNHWPNYFEKAKGISIWDLDGIQYRDFSIMGIGTNTLGYANDVVDARVLKVIQNSNMSTLNAPEEVLLAERLLELHPWFQMARFARTGAEINAMALRIARVASGRTKVAFCGYHGWHDWYLAINLKSEDNLNKHLIEGLSAKGVPENLSDQVTSFLYNDFESMRAAIADTDVGVVFMEVMRSTPPVKGFLEEIRSLTEEKGIVLIFDECTSGFRETFGGLHKKFSVVPDMATFGKALGNGYAITALLGTDAVMTYASETFMSSTFWSERIGFVAGLATLDEMEKIESWNIITSVGEQMANIWKRAFKQHNLSIKISGIPALSTFSFLDDSVGYLKTYLTQEMLKKYNMLASNIFYPSTAHTKKDLDDYELALNSIISDIDNFMSYSSVKDKLIGPVAHSKFNRLN